MNTKKLANLIVNYSLKVKPGQIISIVGSVLAEPFIKECFKEVLNAGGHPIVNMLFSEYDYMYYKYASKEQLEFLSEIDYTRVKNINGLIRIDCEENTKSLTRINPDLIALKRNSSKPLREILDERETKGEFKWVVVAYPSLALAQDAEMSLEEYSDFVFNACKTNCDDPIGEWNIISSAQKEALSILQNSNKIRIVGKETDISFSVKDRKWINCDGTCNMPDGELYTSPVEDSGNGHIYFEYPCCYNGVEVEGVRLQIENGIITKATAEKGEDFLLAMLNTDEGSKFIGEVAFGMNYNIQNFSKNILFDEKIGGTMHIAVGASYTEAGGLNKSGLHWDMVKDMSDGEVYIDDKLVYKNGTFL